LVESSAEKDQDAGGGPRGGRGIKTPGAILYSREIPGAREKAGPFDEAISTINREEEEEEEEEAESNEKKDDDCEEQQ